MWQLDGRTPLELFNAVESCESGMGSYLQAEVVAVYRAVDILKALGPGETMTVRDWANKAVEFANQFPNIGCKYRDVMPLLFRLQDYGLVKFTGSPDNPETNEDWDRTSVRITAKGFLAERREYFTEEEPERPDYFSSIIARQLKPTKAVEWATKDDFDDAAFLEELKRM